MKYRIEYSRKARADVRRLMAYLAFRDAKAARQAQAAIVNAIKLLENFPFSARLASEDDPTLREMIVGFGNSGYLALYAVRGGTVYILAIRHQLEDDYF